MLRITSWPNLSIILIPNNSIVFDPACIIALYCTSISAASLYLYSSTLLKRSILDTTMDGHHRSSSFRVTHRCHTCCAPTFSFTTLIFTTRHFLFLSLLSSTSQNHSFSPCSHEQPPIASHARFNPLIINNIIPIIVGHDLIPLI